MNAVNSGVTAVDKIQYDNYENTKQDKIADSGLVVLQSGITAAELQRIQNKLIELENRIAALEEEE